MSQPLLLDLFAGAGGAGEGYARAGFRVVGCDLDPKPLRHNPHECYVGDALAVLDMLLAGEAWQGYRLTDFAAIHASPPCQDYSTSRHITHKQAPPRYPRLIGPVRERLLVSGLPYIIENVEDARPEMRNPVMICGTSLGLSVWRHRLFESNVWLFAAGPCCHRDEDVSVRRKHNEYIGRTSGRTYTDGQGRVRWRPAFCPVGEARRAMGIDWMPAEELGEAIPPAYTQWIGAQLITAIGGLAA